jgi:hypothetical protein
MCSKIMDLSLFRMALQEYGIIRPGKVYYYESEYNAKVERRQIIFTIGKEVLDFGIGVV